jgi:glutamate-ammonia-ligase adenylyltransferase
MRVPEDDLENQMEILRQFKNTHVFHVAVSEIQHRLPLKKVSDYLTDVAQVVLRAIFEIASAQIGDRLQLSRQEVVSIAEQHFAVVAFGKMGGFEMSYGSDLDLIFLYDTDPMQPIAPQVQMESSVFFTRLSQRMIHILSTATHSGRLYEVDTRLRPSGDGGMLVNTVSYLKRYLEQEAWTWEHQAVVRARMVVGCDAFRAQFEAIRRAVLCQKRETAQLRTDVQEMRQKMIDHLGSKPGAEVFDIKQDPGGVVDIEFMVQYGVLCWANQYPDMAIYTDTVRILETLARLCLLSKSDAELLTQAYLEYRSAIHLLILQNLKPRVPILRFQESVGRVRAIWQALLQASPE